MYLAKHVYLAKNVYLTDSERATNEEASIRENELSAATLTNPRTQVTNQHSFRVRTCGAKGPYCSKKWHSDSARKAVKLAEPYKPYGGQFLEFCSISLSTYQTCMKFTRKSTEFCQLFCRHYPHRPTRQQIGRVLCDKMCSARSGDKY